MSLSIIIRAGNSDEDVVLISGGSHAVIGLVGEVAKRIEKESPELFEKAFLFLDFGRVNFYDLAEEEFGRIYKLTLDAYKDFTERYPTEVDRETVIGTWRKWQEYLEALESDPRLKPSASEVV